MLYREVVDVDEALFESRELMAMWRDAQQHPESPPFTGGTLDAWPAFVVDAFAICRLEMLRIRTFLQSERAGVTP